VAFGWSWLGVTAAVAVLIMGRALAVGVKRWRKRRPEHGKSKKHKSMGVRVAEMVSRSNPLYDEGPLRR
jgi:hypothetical protein